jgi:hypothetical protein
VLIFCVYKGVVVIVFITIPSCLKLRPRSLINHRPSRQPSRNLLQFPKEKKQYKNPSQSMFAKVNNFFLFWGSASDLELEQMKIPILVRKVHKQVSVFISFGKLVLFTLLQTDGKLHNHYMSELKKLQGTLMNVILLY